MEEYLTKKQKKKLLNRVKKTMKFDALTQADALELATICLEALEQRKASVSEELMLMKMGE